MTAFFKYFVRAAAITAIAIALVTSASAQAPYPNRNITLVLPFAAGTVFPVHQRLIRDFGIPLLEGLLLHQLAATGRHEFLFAASPLPVVGGTGSPINPMAIL